MIPLTLIKTEDNEYRTIMTGFTKTGIVQVITDNPYITVIVEYDNKGSVIEMETQAAPNVKEK